MSIETLRYPVENLELLRKLAEPLAYSALKKWFNNLDPSQKISPNYASIPLLKDLPGQSVRMTSGYMRPTASLAFTNTEAPEEKVTIRGRQHIVGKTIHDVEDLDLLGTRELVWKKGIGNSLNLVPRGLQLRCTYEPNIVTVESAQALTPHTAEVSLQKIALLIVDTPQSL